MSTCNEYKVFDGENFLGFAYERSEKDALLQFWDATHAVKVK